MDLTGCVEAAPPSDGVGENGHDEGGDAEHVLYAVHPFRFV